MEITLERLEASIAASKEAIIAQQYPDGHWRYDVDSHVLPTALHIIALKYSNEEMDSEIQSKMRRGLRGHQLKSGGWGLVPHEEMVLSNSVLTYFALRLLGDQPEEAHMLRARKAILEAGGAEGMNGVARFNLALFGIIPWDACMSLPVEIMLLPSWFPFNIHKVAYWTRLAMVTMAVLQTLDKRPKLFEYMRKSNSAFTLDELFLEDPSKLKLLPKSNHQSRLGYFLFKSTDSILKCITPYIPAVIRGKALSMAISFCAERLNGLDGFGCIIPCMFYILMMYEALGYDVDHPDRVMAREALKGLIIVREKVAFTAPCFVPTWDMVNVMSALLDIGDSSALESVEKGLKYLKPLQILEIRGDWAKKRPHIRPGGWAVYSRSPHYPDTEDTAMVVLMMHRFSVLTRSNDYEEAIARGMEWLLGMQSSNNGGWAPYEVNNTQTYLHNLPVSTEEAGSTLDPPDANVTSTIISAFAEMGYGPSNCEAVRRAVDYVLGEQEVNGSWFGRWAVNYIYGTKMALCALSAARLRLDHPSIAKAVTWLLSVQNPDGGWGEGVQSYNPGTQGHVPFPSTATQTAWALIGLLSVIDPHHPAIRTGVQHLIDTQTNGQWVEDYFTATAFPRLLLLCYDGFPKYFPLQALAKYLNKRNGNLEKGYGSC